MKFTNFFLTFQTLQDENLWKSNLCKVCDQLSILRCNCCEILYCSGKCQLMVMKKMILFGIFNIFMGCFYQDWDNHKNEIKSKQGTSSIRVRHEPTFLTDDRERQESSSRVNVPKKDRQGPSLQKSFSSIKDQAAKVYNAPKRDRRGPPVVESTNSMTFKLMEPHFPENVKNGMKISVQGRLAKALEKSDKVLSAKLEAKRESQVGFATLQPKQEYVPNFVRRQFFPRNQQMKMNCNVSAILVKLFPLIFLIKIPDLKLLIL